MLAVFGLSGGELLVLLVLGLLLWATRLAEVRRVSN
jgi:hypothetical protein